MVATSISYYKVIEKIGQGSMGEVYLAQDKTLNRNYADQYNLSVPSGMFSGSRLYPGINFQ